MRNHNLFSSLLFILMLGFAFASSGSAQEDIEFVPGEDSGFYYTIKKGDTLWDLSQKFYNSQWDWPGLWEMNDDIKNPHWIYPGNKIRIFLKDKARLKPIVVPVKKAAPEPVKASFSFSQMDSIGFLRKEKQPSLGHIIKEKDGHLLMTQNDIIYLNPSGKGSLIPGKTYQIFSVGPVSEEIDNTVFEGFRHLIKARVKVLEHKVSYVTAQITHSYRPAEIGDLIMEYTPKNKILTVEENPDTIDSRIVCSQDDHLMINDYIIGFINAGKNTVKPGQIYTVFRKNILADDTPSWPKKKKENIELENLESGKLIILHTEDISSTVMILSSGYAIRPNDPVN
jgi:hypothetical protein